MVTRKMRASPYSLFLLALAGAACTEGLPDRPEVHTVASAAPIAPLDAALPSAASAPANATSDAGGPYGEPAPFTMPPLAPGYQRLEAPPVDVPMGSSEDWAQWVGGPLDQDYDVLDITGGQSSSGHHAILYATADAHPVGFTRPWQDADQLTTRIMGGIGGEGGANARLPPGVVFRVQKGSYLVMQTHFLNAQPRTLVGRSFLDIKLAPVDRSRRVASIMSSTTLHLNVLPGSTVVDVSCPVGEDLHFIQIVNHMHDYGRTALTEFTDPAGSVHQLKSDTFWTGEWALNPNFTHYAPETPLVVPKGSMLHTRCTFANQTAKEVPFPAEMCVFFGFILSESDIYCTDGKWVVTDKSGQGDVTNADAGVAAGDAGGVDAGSFGCQSSGDQAIMTAATFDQKSTDCSLPCAFDADVASCTARCFQKDVGLSVSCARCNGTNVACGAKLCLADCVSDSASPACRSCVQKNCDAAFHMCTGT